MNLLEFENKQFGDLWDQEAIEELKKQEPIKREGKEITFSWESEGADPYTLYEGRYLAESVLY